METAVSVLKLNTTDIFYRRQCWQIIHGFIVASMRLDDNRQTVLKLLTHPALVLLFFFYLFV
jgi:hypothetical protein